MDTGIHLKPTKNQGLLTGFTIAGRTPITTSEWMMTLVSMLHQVATQPALPHSALLHATENTPHTPEDPVATLPTVATVPHELDTYRNQLHSHPYTPLALIVLHPAGAIPQPELEEPGSNPTAVGAILLPGIPDLGLDHRAAWAAVDITGSVQRMSFTTHATLTETIDIAVLGALLD